MWRPLPCVLAVSLLLPAAAGAQDRHPSLVIEDSYREALEQAGDGSLTQVVSRVLGLERGSSEQCILAIELRTAKELARKDPESLVVQAFLRLGVRQARYATLRASREVFGFERLSIAGLKELVDLYVATAQNSDATSMAAGLLTYLAHGVAGLRSGQRLETARELLEDAVGLDPGHLAALHSLAVTLELLGRPTQALPHLDRLVLLEPEDPRYRVRRAVVTVKSGRLDRGRPLLLELTTDGPIWARELAIQELARLLLAGGQHAEAETLLRQSLLELPREKLSLQLAAQLDPNWTESWRVLSAGLGESQADSGPSPRWIYEEGASEEIKALRLELGSGVTARLAGLKNALRRLPELPDSHRKILAGCR